MNKMNYPPQTGQNIIASSINAPSTSSVVDPFFQNHPFFSQLQQSQAHQQQQQQEQSNPLQNYFK